MFDSSSLLCQFQGKGMEQFTKCVSEYITRSQSEQAQISQDLRQSDEMCVFGVSVFKFLRLSICLSACMSYLLHTVIHRQQGLHPPALQHVGELHVDRLHWPCVA